MNPKPELGSPITMDSPNENKVRGELHTSSFVKFCHPYKSSLRRFFVGLEPMWSEINAIEFTEDLPVGYVRETTMPAEVSVHRLVQTSHPNLVNLREVFIADGSAFFVYEKWGISLAEIYRLSPLFQLGEIEVATICREALKGVQYIHNTIGITHGELADRNIHIMEDGNVKLGESPACSASQLSNEWPANVGESMLARPNSQRRTTDIKSLCNIVRTLLGLDNPTAARGTITLLAVDFINAPPMASVDQLLKHPFLNISTGPWCLRPANILCSIIQKFPK